jgi:putative ABC transport system permease protein
MAVLKQISVVSVMNLSSLRDRLGASLVIVFGMAAVVGMMVSVLSMSVGALRSMDTYRKPDRVMVRAANTQWEQESNLPREAALKIADAAGLKKGSDGKPLASPEFLTFIPATKRVDGLSRGLAIRAGTANLFELRPEFKLIEGRTFTPGLRELIVGKEARDALVDIDLGVQVQLPDGPWTIVGIYESKGLGDWALFGDSNTLLPVFRRTAFNSVTATLESPEALDTFRAALDADPTLDVIAERETDYWGRWLKPQVAFFNIIAYGVGAIMGFGAIFAALNIMYAAVSGRTMEIATLRAIGFSPTPIVVSIFLEAFLLAGIGAIAGVTIAWLICDGRGNSNSGFHMIVSPGLAAVGFGIALAIGSIAALFPAIRAARLPFTTALQVR